MSVEASKWARMADVQKSSSKLVLLNLAQLVRYDAEHWTVFASIDYLAKVTHLNRKTVIEALGRLRELGAIQDTGRRAGDNRSSIIYRLCPNAVPLIDLAASGTVAGGESQNGQHDLSLRDGPQEAPCDAPAGNDQPGSGKSLPPDQDGSEGEDLPSALAGNPPRTLPEAPSPHCGGLATSSSQESAFVDAPTSHAATLAFPGASSSQKGTTSSKATGGRRRNRRRPPEARGAGAGATRLPGSWTLPERWRQWAQDNRPLWTQEKIEAMAATFSAYMRSRPGELGTSPDWFESWRLWVFRERETAEATGESWQNTWTGIVDRGKKLGLEQAPNEPPPHFKARVFLAAGLVPSH